jgi:hypothetical protein
VKRLKIFLCCVLLSFSIGVFAKGAKAQITVKLTDENDVSIANTNIIACVPPPVSWSGSNIDETTQWTTDENGICIIDVKVYSIVYIVVKNTNEFYGHIEKIRFKDISNGKWQPWNPTIEIKLKEKINLIPMYAKREEGKLPQEGVECGYDLTKGDWVVPYGKGETADFIFKVIGTHRTVPGKTRFPDVYYDYTLTLSFSNPDDGIQDVYAPPHLGSELRLAQEAPATGYKDILKLRFFREENKASYDNLREDQNYYFRVRTKRDRKGNIINALYGKISGSIIFGAKFVNFTYYLNPDPTSRSLEWDGENNLLKYIKPTSLLWPQRN